MAAIFVLVLLLRSDLRMQESAEHRHQQFIEGMRPRVEIATPKIDFTDTISIFYVDFDNMGVADAEDLSIYFVLKYVDEPEYTAYGDTDRIAKLTKASPLNNRWPLRKLKKVNLTCFIKVRYTWTIQNLDYQNEKYYQFIYYEELEKYTPYRLDEAQIKKLW